MEEKAILSKLQEIFCDVLDNEDIILSSDSSADDIEEWDSLSNIQLIVSIEHEFGVRFSSTEIVSWKNVGDMILALKNKIQ